MSESNLSPESDFSSYDLEFSAVSWNVSDYINFTGPPIEAGHITRIFRIFVDDNDPSYNWSITALNNSWCTGSGTEIDPYVIENLYINGNGTGGMIFIRDSDKHFIIRDCWFNFSGPNEYDVGVLVQYATNGLIVNNSFTYTHAGVITENSISNVTVDNNIFISDHTTTGWGRAIKVAVDSYDVVVSNNKIRDYYSGIRVSQSVNITVNSNYIENNVWEGFIGSPFVGSRINETKIIRNVFAGSFTDTSTFIVSDTGGQGNTVINNTVGAGDPWVFGPETAETFLISPQLSQGPSCQISLIHNSSNNLIAHNVLHGFIEEGNDETIHVFDIVILIGMFGVISVLIAIIRRRNQ